MSGTPKLPAPKDDAEWARNTQRRVEGLETPASQRVGDWVVSTGPTGALIGSNVNGGSGVILQVPVAGDENPDTVAVGSPKVKLQRNTLQAITGNTWTVIAWEAEEFQVGQWVSNANGATIVTVPEDGVYQIVVRTVWPGLSTARAGSGIRVNGVILTEHFDFNSGSAYPRRPTVIDTFSLTRGDVIAGMCWVNPGASHGLDSSGGVFYLYSSLCVTKQGDI